MVLTGPEPDMAVTDWGIWVHLQQRLKPNSDPVSCYLISALTRFVPLVRIRLRHKQPPTNAAADPDYEQDEGGNSRDRVDDRRDCLVDGEGHDVGDDREDHQYGQAIAYPLASSVALDLEPGGVHIGIRASAVVKASSAVAVVVSNCPAQAGTKPDFAFFFGGLLPVWSAREHMSDQDEELTYADAGVDIEASEAATGALLSAVGDVVDTEYAGMLPIDDKYLALATDGVGTKLLVAEAIKDYSTIGIDCIAMNVNDLVAAGVEPLAFVDYLAVEDPDEAMAEGIGEGLAAGADKADIALLGGETAVLPDVITGFDLAGACVGMAPQDVVFEGEAQPGDALVGVPSNGIHSNGLTLARTAITSEYDYTDPYPHDTDRTIGEVLLEPTRLYTDLLGPLYEHDVRACAHVTGGGFCNLARMGDHHYAITDPHPIPSIFEFVQACGDVPEPELYRTFNMGTGFVATVESDRAKSLASAVDGDVIGHVEEGSGVTVRDVELETGD